MSTAVADYSPGPFMTTFGTGAGDRQCIDISLVADDLIEGTETFDVVLNLPSAENPMVLAGDPETTIVHILQSPGTIL